MVETETKFPSRRKEERRADDRADGVDAVRDAAARNRPVVRRRRRRVAVRRGPSMLDFAWPHDGQWRMTPSVDVAESDKEFEITAELPGMSEKDVELTLANGKLGHQGREEGRARGAKGRLLFVRAPLRLVRARLRAAAGVEPARSRRRSPRAC